jgi:hypothetical protein
VIERLERSLYVVVVAGLVPAIHVSGPTKQDVDARDKRGHDGGEA